MGVLRARALASNWTDDDESSTLNLITWVFTITTVSIIGFILAHRMYAERRWRPHGDEVLLAITGILEFMQAASSAWQLNRGYSMNVHDLNEAAVIIFMKAGYVKSFFYVAILAMAKISTLKTLKELTPQKRRRMLILSLKVLVALCLCSSLIALGLRCAPPQPWNTRNNKCINRSALAIFICVWDVFTDLAVVAMAFLILRTLNISKLSRRCCLAAFSFRLLCIPISIIHLVYTIKYTRAADFAYALYARSLTSETQYLIVIIATSIPYITILADPLRNAYLAAMTQGPTPTLRLSWPRKPRSPKKTLRFLNPLGNRSQTNSLVQDMGLVPLGSTMGRASRASGSSESPTRTPRTTSRNDDREEAEDGVKQTKMWSVRQVKLPEKKESGEGIAVCKKPSEWMVRQVRVEDNMRRAL